MDAPKAEELIARALDLMDEASQLEGADLELLIQTLYKVADGLANTQLHARLLHEREALERLYLR